MPIHEDDSCTKTVYLDSSAVISKYLDADTITCTSTSTSTSSSGTLVPLTTDSWTVTVPSFVYPTNDGYIANKEDVEECVAKIKDYIEKTDRHIDELEEDIAYLTEKKDLLELDDEDLRDKIIALKVENNQLQAQNNTMKMRIDAAEQGIAQLNNLMGYLLEKVKTND